MKNHNVVVGIFVTVAIVLFAACLFFIGNQHKAFSRHVVFYTNFQNVDGIPKGRKSAWMAWMRGKWKISRSPQGRHKNSG